MTVDKLHAYSTKRLNYLVFTLLLSSIACVIILFTRIIITGSHRYFFLIWNLFLAWIPFIISLVIYRFYILYYMKNFFKPVLFIFSFIWLIFYPNAPYILTDFIYIANFPSYIPLPLDPDIINPNTILWYDILLSTSFSFIGHFIGLISLVIIHRIFDNLFNKYIGWIFATGSILLAGFGIFAGRFIRLNSWDFFTKPSIVVNQIYSGFLNIKAISFSLYFSTFVLITYLVIHSFHELVMVRNIFIEDKNIEKTDKTDNITVDKDNKSNS
jgi:uncharacterized membrane protein